MSVSAVALYASKRGQSAGMCTILPLVILRWSSLGSPSMLSEPEILRGTLRSSGGSAGSRCHCWRARASQVRYSLSTIRSRVYGPRRPGRLRSRRCDEPLPARIAPRRDKRGLGPTGVGLRGRRIIRKLPAWRQLATLAGGRLRNPDTCRLIPRFAKHAALAAGVVVFFDNLLAYHAATYLRSSAFLEGFGLLGVACGRRLPSRLIGGGPCATDGRSALGGLSRAPVPG